MVEPVVSADGNARLYVADAAHMDELADASVDLEVTSPPYGIGLLYNADYARGDTRVTPGQVEAPVMNWTDYAAYLERLRPIWREMYRVLKPGGYAALNIAPIHTKAAYFQEDSSMLPTTERMVQFWLDDLGARYRWRYTWVARRTRNNSRGDPQAFLGSYGHHADGNYGLPLRGQVLREIEDIVVFQKGPLVISEEREARRRQQLSRISYRRWSEIFSQVWMDLPGETQNGGHPAVFPEEIARRLIEGYSVVGDTVLDPFVGSGTTLLACRDLGRKGIGYEVERGYEPLITAKARFFEERMENVW